MLLLDLDLSKVSVLLVSLSLSVFIISSKNSLAQFRVFIIAQRIASTLSFLEGRAAINSRSSLDVSSYSFFISFGAILLRKESPGCICSNINSLIALEYSDD